MGSLLDASGNPIGKEVFITDLRSVNGVFKNGKGEEREYVLAEAPNSSSWRLLDKKGNLVASVDRAGFLHEITSGKFFSLTPLNCWQLRSLQF